MVILKDILSTDREEVESKLIKMPIHFSSKRGKRIDNENDNGNVNNITFNARVLGGSVQCVKRSGRSVHCVSCRSAKYVTNQKKTRVDESNPCCSHHNGKSQIWPPNSVVKSGNMAGISALWEITPREIMANVFSYLSDKDRCQASQSCKQWRTVFFLPYLWRARCFAFSGTCAVEAQERYRSFIYQLGHHMRHVTLDFGRPSSTTACLIASAFKEFVRLVRNYPSLKIVSINIRNLNLHQWWQVSSVDKDKMIRALCLLLKKQSHLESADMARCLMTAEEGTRVLEALAYSNKQVSKMTLRRLVITNFFALGVRVSDHAMFADILGRFSGLSHIIINQRYISQAAVEKLTTSSAATLRTVEVIATADNTIPAHAISSSTWLAVTERCPHLRIVVQFVGLCCINQYPTILVENLPLSEVWVKCLGQLGERNPVVFVGLEKLIHCIANLFCKSISKVRLTLLSKSTVSLDQAVFTLVQKCLLLRDLSLTGMELQPKTLQDITGLRPVKYTISKSPQDCVSLQWSPRRASQRTG